MSSLHPTADAGYFSNGVVLSLLNNNENIPDEYDRCEQTEPSRVGPPKVRLLMKHKKNDTIVKVVDNSTQKNLYFVVRKGASIEYVKCLYETYVRTICDLKGPPQAQDDAVYIAWPDNDGQQRARTQCRLTLPSGATKWVEEKDIKKPPKVIAKGDHAWMNELNDDEIVKHPKHCLLTLDFDVVELRGELKGGVTEDPDRERVEKLLRNEEYAKVASVFVHWGEAFLIARRLKKIKDEVTKDDS